MYVTFHYKESRLSHTISLYLSASPSRGLLSTEKVAAVLGKDYQSAAVGISAPE